MAIPILDVDINEAKKTSKKIYLVARGRRKMKIISRPKEVSGMASVENHFAQALVPLIVEVR